MSKGIPLPRVEGRVHRQAHADLPEGCYERELGREGFAGPATHMLHTHPPTGWSAFEGPLRPRAYDTTRLEAKTASPFEAAELFANASLRVRFWCSSGTMDALARNADGDELCFVHEGSGDLFCDYGHWRFRDGDYLLLPRGTQWRIESPAPVRMLLIEASGASYRLPERGLLGEHALFDPALLETPHLDAAFQAQQDESSWRVEVKARGRLSRITYPWNPLDAVGWKGTLAPLRLNWRDIRPVVSPRYHLPPSAHTTFVSDRFAVSTFCPRPLESDPGALKLPFFHSNDDVDELLFYHAGRFMSRDDVGPGTLTWHPFGFPHGPHPKALRESQRQPRTHTDEVALMIDSFEPLDAGDAAAAIERPDYADSWREPAR